MATFYISLTWRIVAFTLGSRLKLTLFGASHGELVGAILDGLPSGILIDKENMQKWLDLRRPAQSDITTQRKEQDLPEIVSGIVNGHTDGGPVTVIIRNTDAISNRWYCSGDRCILFSGIQLASLEFPLKIRFIKTGFPEDMIISSRQ